MLRKIKPIEERFWAKVDKTLGHGPWGDCWKWTGVKTHGYGFLGAQAPIEPGARPHKSAHRLSYEMHNGAIPDGHDVCHACDNPSCVNPAHLSTGTRKENMEQAKQRGRTRNGPGLQVVCKNGHPLEMKKSGGRFCPVCAKEWKMKHNIKRRVGRQPLRPLCTNGHEYAIHGYIRQKTGDRICKICLNEYKVARRAKKKLANLPVHLLPAKRRIPLVAAPAQTIPAKNAK